MDKSTRRMLNDDEQSIIRLIESKRFAKLDAEELIALHTRVRRARNKYATLRRRRGATKVRSTGSRALATKAIGKTAAKAELFEGALATVSARLAKVTAANAKALKAERLAAARAAKKAATKKGTAGKAAAKKAAKKGTGGQRVATRAPKKATSTPASKRKRAAQRASGKRKQAKRDKR